MYVECVVVFFILVYCLFIFGTCISKECIILTTITNNKPLNVYFMLSVHSRQVTESTQKATLLLHTYIL